MEEVSTKETEGDQFTAKGTEMTYDDWYQANYGDVAVSHADYTFGEEVWKAARREILGGTGTDRPVRPSTENDWDFPATQVR